MLAREWILLPAASYLSLMLVILRLPQMAIATKNQFNYEHHQISFTLSRRYLMERKKVASIFGARKWIQAKKVGVSHVEIVELPWEYHDNRTNEYFMGVALEQARCAKDKGEVPIGAVIVRRYNEDKHSDDDRSTQCELVVGSDGKSVSKKTKFLVLSKGHNLVESSFDASAHAELQALRKGASNMLNWRYPSNSTLYTTLEPCPLCLASMQAFRIDNIVYGAKDNRLGAAGTHMDLINVAKHPYHQVKTVIGGIREDECADVLLNFFREKRKERKNGFNGSSPRSDKKNVARKYNIQSVITGRLRSLKYRMGSIFVSLLNLKQRN